MSLIPPPISITCSVLKLHNLSNIYSGDCDLNCWDIDSIGDDGIGDDGIGNNSINGDGKDDIINGDSGEAITV